MNHDRWLQIEPLLQEALELPERECRAFLDRVCARNEPLRRELEAYLVAFRQGGILNKPAAEHLTAMAGDESRRTTMPVAKKSPTAEASATKNGRGASRKPDLLAIGTVLDDHYKIEKEIGRGKTGIVYLAQDRRLGNQVVIKVLNEEVRSDENRKWIEDKFRQEIALLARINHPGVVGALDVGELADGRPYLVMQYVPGHSLREAITVGGMYLARIGSLMQQLCQALTAVHEHNVIHRDLKPENLLLLQAGGAEYVIIIDLGVAKVRAELAQLSQTTTMTAGTFGYMAPEQLQGHPTKASDIYALGSVLYELVTGQALFNTNDWYEMMQAQRDGSFAKPRELRPELPAAVEAVILKALSYDESDRYASAKEFGDALKQALAATTRTAEQPEFVQAHVLFTDLVGYSQQAADEQARLVQTLQAVVSATASFRQAQTNHRLLCLPTGDGMALVFFGNPLAPVQCAVEIARALKAHPAIKLRMGIHAGLIKHFADINQNLNSAGGGINIAERVMSCGDAGHILLS
ncbi:MAG: protein kinase domain-containing protein, partial [Blastocatellia bacterium]